MPIGLGGRYFPRIPRHTQRFRDLYRGRAAGRARVRPLEA
jgi:hypothetical protein